MARQIFDRIRHGVYRARNFGCLNPERLPDHVRPLAVARSPKPLNTPKLVQEHSDAVLPIGELWYSRDPEAWLRALDRYWTFVQPRNIELERRMETVERDRVRVMTADEWFAFLHDDYFPWKYTEPKRYATTTGVLRRKADNPPGRLALDRVRNQLFAIDPVDVRSCIDVALRIPGLGTAGASGLLAILDPDFFGTVDQFAVKALCRVPNYPKEPRSRV